MQESATISLFFEYQIQQNMEIRLTLQERKQLIEMLKAHYQLENEAFIDSIAENEQEKVDLTLKAFSVQIPKFEQIKNSFGNTESVTETMPKTNSLIKITHLCGKINLIKGIKETLSIGLKEAKDISDVIVKHETNWEGKAQYTFQPFLIGDDIPKCLFTAEDWFKLCRYMNESFGKDALNWDYV